MISNLFYMKFQNSIKKITRRGKLRAHLLRAPCSLHFALCSLLCALTVPFYPSFATRGELFLHL